MARRLEVNADTNGVIKDRGPYHFEAKADMAGHDRLPMDPTALDLSKNFPATGSSRNG